MNTVHDKFGSTLVEVFSVVLVIDGMEDVTSADIEGVFQLSDISSEFIDCYKKVDGSPSVHPDGTLSLSGPYRCLVGPDFGFLIRLKETKNNLEICDGQHSIGAASYIGPNSYPLSAVVPGENGYAIVNYMLFTQAAQATVEVSLLAPRDVETAIDGRIWATHNIEGYDNIYDDNYCNVTLFHVSEENAKKPNEDGTIPLSRSTVVIPLGARLKVKADIYQGSQELATDEFVWFDSQLSGEMIGSMGGIRVKVTWDFDPFKASGVEDHPLGTYVDGKLLYGK